MTQITGRNASTTDGLKANSKALGPVAAPGAKADSAPPAPPTPAADPSSSNAAARLLATAADVDLGLSDFRRQIADEAKGGPVNAGGLSDFRKQLQKDAEGQGGGSGEVSDFRKQMDREAGKGGPAPDSGSDFRRQLERDGAKGGPAPDPEPAPDPGPDFRKQLGGDKGDADITSKDPLDREVQTMATLAAQAKGPKRFNFAELIDQIANKAFTLVKDGALKVLSALAPGAAKAFAEKLGQTERDVADIGADFSSTQTHKIERLPGDPNSAQYQLATSQLKSAAELAANRPDEDAALAKLSGAERRGYERAASVVDANPVARRALQALLLDGRLGDRALVGGDNLVEILARMADQELAPGVDRACLMGCLLEEIADPTKINQCGKGTCAPTTIQIVLAKTRPAEYARVVAGLAAPAGSVTLKSGDELVREPDWNASNDAGRTPSCRLVQSAFMEFADGDDEYDNTADRHTSTREAAYRGLKNEDSSFLLDSLVGTRTRAVYGSTDAMMQKIAKGAELPEGVPTAVFYVGEGLHLIHVNRVEGGRVYFTNPWARDESMTSDDFQKILYGAILPVGIA